MKLLRYGPAGQEKPGLLDREGKVRFEGIATGRASICFPGMDRKEWRPLSGSSSAA